MNATLPILLVAAFLGPAASNLGQESRPVEKERRVQSSKIDREHAAWTTVLKARVRNGRFDYAREQKNDRQVVAYTLKLTSVTREQYDRWKREERMAFWINAYNAFTVRRVLDKYPIDSIKDLDTATESVWDQRTIPMPDFDPEGKGRNLSLNDIEHSILREEFGDPRIHAALNCASTGCPPLRDRAYTAEGLEKELSLQFRAWLADPAHNRFHSEERVVELSKVFEWFAEDFRRDGKSVLGWVVEHAPKEERDWLREERPVTLRHLEYDWSLNDVEQPDQH